MKSPVADKYAKAIFQVTEENGVLEDVAEKLKTIKKLLEDKEIQQFFFTSQISPEDKLKVIQGTFDNQLGSILQNSLMVIFRNKRQMAIPDIIDEFIKIYNQKKNIAEVMITFAHEIDSKLLDQIKERLNNLLHKEIVLNTTIDPELIGGLKLRVGNVIFDASLKNRLQKLQQKLLAS